MKSNLKPYLVFLVFAVIGLLSSCDAIIEPSINKKQVQPQAPADLYQSSSYGINFWWDQVDHALSYHLQVVTPNFNSPGSLVLDTIVKRNRFSINLNPGNYQWRVLAQNGSSQTAYTAPRNFTVEISSLKGQAVQLSAPADNYITNQGTIVFQWGVLFGATQYRFEIDTNNFANESAVILNQAFAGQQLNFTFPKDKSYQWRVRAENDTAQSQWSAINLVTYDHTPPLPVSLVAPTNNQTLSLPVLLQWSSAVSAVKYKVYVFKSDSISLFNQNFPVQVSTLNYSFTLGSSGDKIYWKVTALDAAGNESTGSILRSFVLQ
jgi:uncharacterized protein YceK